MHAVTRIKRAGWNNFYVVEVKNVVWNKIYRRKLFSVWPLPRVTGLEQPFGSQCWSNHNTFPYLLWPELWQQQAILSPHLLGLDTLAGNRRHFLESPSVNPLLHKSRRLRLCPRQFSNQNRPDCHPRTGFCFGTTHEVHIATSAYKSLVAKDF